MALIRCDFKSDVLGLRTSMNVVLPEVGVEGDRESGYPVLYLLHGLSDDFTAWQRFTSVERYARERGLAVVMPEVHRSFYTDMEHGYPYWTFVTEEVPHVAGSYFPLSQARKDSFVAGLSMGGYGAFKMAFSLPERFSAASSLSGALDVNALLREATGPEKNDMRLAFGDVDDLGGTEHDLYRLAEEVAESDGPKPSLYQCCGTGDELYKINADFHEFIEDLGLDIEYDEGPGGHEWDYWDRKIRDVLDWLPVRDDSD